MLELSNLCHCVQHPRKLTNRHFWICKKESKPLYDANICFVKMLWDISDTWWNARAFKPLPLCSAPLKTWLVGISGGLRNEQKATFSCKKVFWENAEGYLQIQWMLRAFKHLPLYSATSDNWLIGISAVLEMKESYFLSYPSASSQSIFLLRKWLSFIFWTPEMPTSQFSEVLNTMANVWKL